jgi:hypothetical protein
MIMIKNVRKLNWATLGIPLKRPIRIPVAAILFSGIVISALVLFNTEDPEPTISQTANPLFSYAHEAAIDYQVQLKPNTVYDGPVLESGQTYFAQLFDSIDVFTSYDFSSDSPARITGDYSATAYIQAENIPTKEFPMTLNSSEADLVFGHAAELDYEVYLKPNNLYTAKILGPGETYFTNIVDYFNIHANYMFESDKSPRINGEYEIVAILTAVSYWEKSYVIVPRTMFDVNRPSLNLAKDFTIDLAEYGQLASVINTELGIYPREINVTIQFNVQLNGKTEDGSAPQILSSTMVIPLTTTQFMVDGNPSSKGSGTIFKRESEPSQQRFSANGTYGNFDDDFTIELKPYLDALDIITEQTGVLPQEPRLLVELEVDVTIESDEGPITERLVPHMIIPLSGKTIEIGGELTEANSGSIDDMDTKTITPSRKTAGPIASVLLFSVFFVGFMVMTRDNVITKTVFEKHVDSTNKRYRDQLVAADFQPPVTNQQIISVNSIEDLSLVAEELGKPIIYQISPHDSHIYSVFDGAIIYDYTLEKELDDSTNSHIADGERYQ